MQGPRPGYSGTGGRDFCRCWPHPYRGNGGVQSVPLANAVFQVFQVFQNRRKPVTARLAEVEHLTAQRGTPGVPDARGVPPWAGLKRNTMGG